MTGTIIITALIILYCKMCAMSKKPNRSMDRIHLHRAGLVINKTYRNDSSVHEYDFYDPNEGGRLTDGSEGEEFVSQRPQLN